MITGVAPGAAATGVGGAAFAGVKVAISNLWYSGQNYACNRMTTSSSTGTGTAVMTTSGGQPEIAL